MSSPRVLITGSHNGLVRSFFFSDKTEHTTSELVINGTGEAFLGGELTVGSELKLPGNPTWVEKHPYLPNLFYANSASPTIGKIYLIQLDPTTAAMTIISESLSGGRGPCHMSVTKDGSTMFVADYMQGTISALHLSSKDGTFSTSEPSPSQVHQFTVTSSVHERQHEPHPHQVLPVYSSGASVPEEILVPDLGADCVWRMGWNGGWTVKGKVEGFAGGSGPRHVLVHPDGKHLYTLNEIASTLSIHTFPTVSSNLAPQILSTHTLLPSDYPPSSPCGASELLFLPPHPSQSRPLLLCSNRDSTDPRGDTLVLFSLSSTDGADIRREGEGWVYGCGKHLRGMKNDGTGEMLGVVARNGGGLSVFRRGGGEWGLVAREEGVEMGTDVLWM